MVTLKVKKERDDAIVPSYTHEGDAGLDLYSSVDCSLEQGQRMTIPVGVSIELPAGHVGLVWPRSGLSAKKGVDVLAGVIDEGFRGELKVVLLNTGYDDLVVRRGDRIAQLIVQPVSCCDVSLVDEFSESLRGEGGFGSSGV